MPHTGIKSDDQRDAEADVESFRRDLGPFVVAAERTRMAMAFTDARDPANPIIFANDSFLMLTGSVRENVLGQPFSDLIADLAKPEALAMTKAAFFAGGSDNDAEIHCRRNDGSEFWASVFISPVRDRTGRLVQHFVSLVELTEHKRSELALKEAVERFQFVSQATADVVLDWNLVDDTVWWSDAMRSLFGHDTGKALSRSNSWTDHIHASDRDRVLHDVHALISGHERQWSAEYRFLCANGACREVVHRGLVIRDHSGKSVRMVGSMIDVTKQRALEAQLRQAQRLDAVGQLTGGVAHDFNNLLTVILCSAEALESRLAGEPKILALAEIVRVAAERGAELTHRLLSFSRRQALDPKSTNVNTLVSGMAALLHRALGEHIETVMRADADLWPALIDAPQLESAVLNLCINARDAMPHGGRITIDMTNIEVDARSAPQLANAAPGQYVLIAVCDNGAGMDADTLAHAFDPFFTTKEVGKGSGLGLSMVHGFVEQSKGRVTIESLPGQGACVKLYLPRALRDTEPTAEPAAAQILPTGFEKVLVVEDNDLVRAQVISELEGLGYRVVSAENGAQALAALRENADFDLLFTDLVMPGGMNGRQLADEGRKLRPNLPVLFTSGYADDGIVHHGLLDAGVELLKKPYRRLELAAKIRQVLSGATGTLGITAKAAQT